MSTTPTPTAKPTPGTRNGKKSERKADMSDEEIAQESLTRNTGTLNNPQATLATHLLRAQYTQNQLREGKIVPFTWQRAASILHLAEFAKDHPEYQELYSAADLAELVKEIQEVFPYDRQKWASHRKFVCSEGARDINGRPPGIGLVLLPIDPFRQP